MEVLKEFSLRVAPISRSDAEEMVSEGRAAVLLNGFRGSAPRDKGALVDLLMKVSKLMAENSSISQLDLNPVLSYEKGAWVVDARVLVG